MTRSTVDSCSDERAALVMILAFSPRSASQDLYMSSSFASFFTSANQHDDTTDAASRLTGDGMVGAAAAAAGGAATESEGDDEDEEDVDVEDLLWAAQVSRVDYTGFHFTTRERTCAVTRCWPSQAAIRRRRDHQHTFELHTAASKLLLCSSTCHTA